VVSLPAKRRTGLSSRGRGFKKATPLKEGVRTPVMAANTVSGSSGAQSAHVVEAWGNQPLLTLKQAAVYAICTPRYLQNQIRAGRLKALKPTGKLLRIRRSDLDAFFEAGATIGGGN
jgi:excisionase family DNA binding protein